MKRQSHISVALVTFMVLTLIIFTALPAFTQGDSTDAEEGSAGGQADVPAVEGPALDRSRVVTEALPEPQLQPHPRGFTQEGVVAKNLVRRGKVEWTTKAVIVADATPGEFTLPDAAASPELDAPILGVTFPGVTDTGQFPPDPTIAAGPFNVVVATNGRVNTFDKAGKMLDSKSLATFFAKLGPPATD